MKIRIYKCVLLSYMISSSFHVADAQETKGLFKWFAPLEKEGISFSRPLRFYEVLCSRAGTLKITSTFGVWSVSGVQIEVHFYTLNDKGKRIRAYESEDEIRSMCESPDELVYFAAHDNTIFWQPCVGGGTGCPPFMFSSGKQKPTNISKIWIDAQNNMFIGTHNDNIYFVKDGAKFSGFEGGIDSTGNFYITKGARPIKKIVLGSNVGIYSFIDDPVDRKAMWIGTNKGLFFYQKDQEHVTSILPENLSADITITHLEVDKKRNIWFSTLEKGMGFYDAFSKTIQFFHYQKRAKSSSRVNYPINTFCRKSANELFVAIVDSLPAIFNTETKRYSFIQDSIFSKTRDSTTDIKLDGLGNLFVIKGGGLYYSNAFKKSRDYAEVKLDSLALAPFVKDIVIAGEPYRNALTTRNLKEIRLKHFENKMQIQCSLAEYWNADNVQFAWKADGYMNEWIQMPVKGEQAGFAILGPLDPGKYFFRLRAKVGDEDWRKQQVQLVIIIEPPFWQTWWFWTIVISGVGLIIGLLLWWRIKVVKRKEGERFAREKQILELEAKALRAQMNPHFIFNCLNSIKSLIQEHDEEKSVAYLTTFSKLIRTLFNNADKKEITLHDEMETCKLYLQLEAMRFDAKFSYSVNTDENIDLKSIHVPALIVQPFIENAIWHGIVPSASGGHVSLDVVKQNGTIDIIVEDDGIGRDSSQQNKSASRLTHHSKGVSLTQSRLELDNLLQQRRAQLEIIDKKDDAGMAKGTKVIIKINEEAA